MLLDSVFEGLDVLKVLGYGLSGFAFLLMFFAFLLLRQVINKEKETNRMIFKSIWAFMGLSFLMTIAIGIFSFFVSDYKKDVINNLGIAVNTYEKVSKADTELEKADSTGVFKDPEAFKDFQEDQEKIIDSLGAVVNTSDADTALKNNFVEAKTGLDSISLQLTNSNINPRKRDSLKVSYIKLYNKISTISIEAARSKTVRSNLKTIPLRN